MKVLTHVGIPKDELSDLRVAIVEAEGNELIPALSEGETGH
jgi:hypothetical protein